MNWLDIIIIIIIAGGVFIGLKTGLIRIALSLAGVIIGILLAGHFYASLAERLTFITQKGTAEVVAFAIIFIAVMVIAVVLAALLRWVVSALLLGWVDHLGGAILGLVLGAIFIGALLAILSQYLEMGDIISHSSLAAILLDRFPAVLALLPGEFGSVRSFFQR